MRNRLQKILDNQQAVVDSMPRFYRRNVSFSDAYRVYTRANGKCEICGAERGPRNHGLDHSHITGKARGVLCAKCNTGLGMFLDNPELLVKAIKYLKDNA